MGKTWALCSGNGGVGQSTLAVYLAIAAAKAGKQTILMDASGISRSCDLLLGLENIVVLDMIDVVSRQITDIQSALYAVPGIENLRFACASLYDSVPVCEFSSAMLVLNAMCDLLIIDLETGQTDLGPGLLSHKDSRILVTRPDDVSIRAAERLMMRCDGEEASLCLVINRMSKEAVKRNAQHTQDAVQMVLDRIAVGCIPEDSAIGDALNLLKPFSECGSHTRAALRDLSKSLLDAL